MKKKSKNEFLLIRLQKNETLHVVFKREKQQQACTAGRASCAREKSSLLFSFRIEKKGD